MYIWIILIGVMVASFIIQKVLQRKFDKYSDVPSPGGLSGAEVARLMLERNGIRGVEVVSIDGKLTDHYNPKDSTINLSRDVYAGRSVAACAVAAHETGHAIQHAKGYAPLKMRSAMVPVVTFANNTVQWVLLAGVLLVTITPALLWLGIALFGLTTLFSLLTLPVEIDASSRAVAWLSSEGVLDAQTKPMAVDALKWAAYTYVIAAVGSLATLLYYISLASGRR
ncbi:MAG: zinc metallopeptidase [Bacteroidales bacterium]|jgi:Zn-dependent membrane protease YugP|nr:zinc metallopeptidase [Bacteroidales bacterium]MBQ2229327.1 zinc metallopeptidase [Bacteroidales bacterium]MBQ5363626.1 zinc metallopeptidase [Bacteroidales bacterium]